MLFTQRFGEKTGELLCKLPPVQGLRAPVAVSELPDGTPSCLPLTKGLGY